MNDKIKFDIKNPIHVGFYESILSPTANGLEEGYIEMLNDEREITLEDNQYAIVEYDYKEYEKMVTTDINEYFINEINSIIKDRLKIENFLTIVGEQLISPSFYNFETDRSFIDVTANKEDLIKVIKYMFKHYYKELENYIYDHHSSYDGFISFYSNDVDVWMDKDILELDSIELSSILDVLIHEYHSEEDLMYELLEISNNCFYDMQLEIIIEEA